MNGSATHHPSTCGWTFGLSPDADDAEFLKLLLTLGCSRRRALLCSPSERRKERIWGETRTYQCQSWGSAHRCLTCLPHRPPLPQLRPAYTLFHAYPPSPVSSMSKSSAQGCCLPDSMPPSLHQPGQGWWALGPSLPMPRALHSVCSVGFCSGDSRWRLA